MEKPISVIRQEFIETLVNVINSSGLPVFVMREVVGGLYKELQIGERKELEDDKEAWKKSQEENVSEEE